MKEVYLVRHGETEGNRIEVFRGRLNIPLNECGFSQAKAVSYELKEKKIAGIYSSPLLRAMQTSDAIADSHRIKIQEISGLTDLDCGEWSGKTLEEVEMKYPELYNLWEKAPYKLTIPGGESFQIAKKRAVSALKGILKDSDGEIIVVVTHRVISKLIILSILGVNNRHFWQIKQDNACINRFLFPENSISGGIILSINDTGHLRDIGGISLGRNY